MYELNHFAVRRKLTHHCWSATIQHKLRFNKKEWKRLSCGFLFSVVFLY